MRVTRRQLRRIIKEVFGVPSWPEKHFAWRNVVFTRDGDVRYINDVASPETLEAMAEMGQDLPPGANVLAVMGPSPNSKSVWMHDSELLGLIDREGWSERPPPPGAKSGFWDGKGEWSEDPEEWSNDLPPEPWNIEEKTVRGKGKNKRLLYHINRFRPAKPQPKMSYMQDWDPEAIDREGDKGDYVNVPGTDNWQRHWLKSPVKSGVFLTPNPLDIAMNHGRSGHVYAYRVPEWVIAKSGGLHRYDTGSEVLIPEDVWNEAGREIEFMGKSMDKEELWDKMMPTSYGRGHHRPGTKPSWMSDEELKQWQVGQDKFNLTGLRSTKHPEDVIKLLTPEERRKAIEAIEAKNQNDPTRIEKGPRDKKGIVVPGTAPGIDKKNQELLALLKKHMNESKIRKYIKELLTEMQYGGPGVQQSIGYGKNYHTVNPQPITWENYEGLSYDISAEGNGSYYASVQVLDYPELSTATRSFPDEGSAEWWVRDTYEKLHRFLLAQSAAE